MSKKYVECASVPCLLPEDIAKDVDQLVKTLPAECRGQMVRKTFTTDRMQFEPNERAEVSIITTAIKDYSNEVILPEGIDMDQFRKHMRVMWNHNKDLPCVGECQWIKLHSDGTVRAKTLYPERNVESDRPWYIDEIWDMVSCQPPILPCKSIGMVPKKPKRPPTPEELAAHPDWEGAGIWEEGLMLEYSVVPIGCLPEATVLYVNTKSLDVTKVAELEKVLGISLPKIAQAEKEKMQEAYKISEDVLKGSDCISRKIKEMQDQGSKYSRAQIAAIAYASCNGCEKVLAPKKRIVKKMPDVNKLIAERLEKISVERIIKRAEQLIKNRGSL